MLAKDRPLRSGQTNSNTTDESIVTGIHAGLRRGEDSWHDLRHVFMATGFRAVEVDKRLGDELRARNIASDNAWAGVSRYLAASAGVRSVFHALHAQQAATRLSTVFEPPRAKGMT